MWLGPHCFISFPLECPGLARWGSWGRGSYDVADGPVSLRRQGSQQFPPPRPPPSLKDALTLPGKDSA